MADPSLTVKIDADLKPLSAGLAELQVKMKTAGTEAAAAGSHIGAAFSGNVVHLDKFAKSTGLAAYQVTNLRSQMLDVGTMLASGSSPLQVLSTQSAQVYEAIAGQKGFSAGLKDLGVTLMGLVTPTRVVAAGFVAAAGAAAYFATRGRDQIKPLNEALEEHQKIIGKVAESYGLALRGREGFGSRAEAAFRDRRSAAELQASARSSLLENFASNRDILRTGRDENGQQAFRVTEEYSAFAKPLLELGNGLRTGKENADAFVRSVAEIANNDPSNQALQKLAKSLIDLADPAAQAKRLLLDLAEAQVRVSNTRFRSAMTDLGQFSPNRMTDRGRLDQALGVSLAASKTEAQERQARETYASGLKEIEAREANIRAGHALDLQDTGRLSAARQRDLAVLRERNALELDYSLTADQKREREQAAGAVAYARAIDQANESLRGRALAMQSMLDGLDMEAKTLGGTIEANERLRASYQLLAQAKEAAYSEGRGNVSAAERDAINATADAIGKATARVQGMRQEQDLLFERSQLLRSDTEQRVAAATRGFSPDSMEANRIGGLVRDIERLKSRKEDFDGLFKGWGRDLLDAKSGADLLEGALDRVKNVAGRQLDRIFDNAADGLFAQMFPQSAAKAELDPIALPKMAGVVDLTASVVNIGGTGVAGLLGAPGQTGSAAAVNALGQGGKLGASSGLAASGSVAEYIRQSAARYGIDPDIALRVAKSEGGLDSWNKQSLVMKGGVQEPSFGPFQLLVGGKGTNFPTGMGNRFMTETGLDPRLAANGQAGIDFALRNASKEGWGAWYGAKAAGIGRWDGIGQGGGTITKDPFAASSDALAQDASKFTAGFSSTLNDGLLSGMGQAVDSFVPGLGGVLQNALRALQSASGGGGAGGFGGLWSSIFGGAAPSSAAVNGILGGSIMAATGGRISGPGTGTSDSIPAMLSDGEFVVNALATRAHLPLLEAINGGARMHHYATGGVVRDRIYVPTPSGMGSGAVQSAPATMRPIINVYNNHGGAEVQTREGQNADGQPTIDVVIDQVMAGKANKRNSQFARAMRAQGVQPPVLSR